MSKRTLRAIVVLIAGLMAPHTASAQIPAGSEFQVNSYTTGPQTLPAVAVDADGDFVVVWHSYGSDNGDPSSWCIQGQRYSSGGMALGSEFLVNSYTPGTQLRPRVAVAADGDFVVVWDSDGSNDSDTSSLSIRAQRFSSDGNTLGSSFQVNSYTTGIQYLSAVAMNASGAFVVTWMSDGSKGTDSSSSSVQAQRYSSGGSALGSQFQVNSNTTGPQAFPTVALGSGGEFVVAWQSYGSDAGDPSNWSVQGQRYAASGLALGPEFLVNTFTPNAQNYPAVALSPDGDFVVVWQSEGSYGDDTPSPSIQAQRYSSAGSTLGGQFQVNSYTTNYQINPAVAMDSNGAFLIAWTSYGSDNGDSASTSIQGQRYSSTGSALGVEFLANSYTANSQFASAVATTPAGDFVVVWSSNGSNGGDTSDSSVQGQRYGLEICGGVPGCQIFSDGFESGDTTTWSATLP
jgi:hypothetical protein